MTTLAYIPSPAQGVWYLGPVPIRAYALFIIVGIVAALVIGDRRWAARGGERGVIYDIALWAVPFGLLGGRLYHVLTDLPTYFGAGGVGPIGALKIWDGGLGIWGAVALGGVGAWIACRRRGIPLPAFGDAVAPGIVLAQAIGRLGNYFNQELYGRETTVPWGLEIYYRLDPSGYVDVQSLDGVSTGQVAEVVHPTFLYELIWNVLVFVALILIDRRFRLGHGRLFAMYVAGYCLGRFWVELLRSDYATLIAGIRINLFTTTFVFIGAVVYILLAPKGREDPLTLGGRSEEPVQPSSGENGLDQREEPTSGDEEPAAEEPQSQAGEPDPEDNGSDDTDSGQTEPDDGGSDDTAGVDDPEAADGPAAQETDTGVDTDVSADSVDGTEAEDAADSGVDDTEDGEADRESADDQGADADDDGDEQPDTART